MATTYAPGDICWAVDDGLDPVLVTAVADEVPLGDGRTMTVYHGCSFRPDQVPDAIERFAVVRGPAPSRSS